MTRSLLLLGLSVLLVCLVGCRRAPGDPDYETDGGSGEYDAGGNVYEDSGPVAEDSGPPPAPDAGPPIVEDAGLEPPDSGPVIEEDAGPDPITPDAGTFPGEPGVASRVAFTRGPPEWQLPAGFCTGQLTTSASLRVAVVDGPGDEVSVDGPTYIGLFTNVPDPDDVRWYTNSTCLDNNAIQSITLPSGASGENIHLKIDAPGTYELRAVPGGGSGLTTGTQEIEITVN